MQRAPTSCSPPLGVAANCAAQRAAETQPKHCPFITTFCQVRPVAPLGRKSNTPFTAPFSGVRPRRAPPAPPKASLPPEDGDLKVAQAQPKTRPKAPPNPQPHARPGTARKPTTVFEPKEQALPRIRLTAAPLSLRQYRSARERWPGLPLFPSPAAILPKLAKCQPAEYALLGGRATDFRAGSSFFAHHSCPRALRDSFYFGSLPKLLNRFFRRRRAKCNKSRPPWRERVRRADAPTGRFTASLYPRSLAARWRKSYSNTNHAFE